MISHGAILHEPWVVGKQPNEIVGKWAEDMSEYTIQVPPQLRDLILTMQNSLHHQYDDLEKCRKHLLALENRAKGILGVYGA